MRHFGTIVFGALTAFSTLAVLWLSHGGGINDPSTTVFGTLIAPVLYLIFVSPFAILFILSLARGSKN